MRTQTATFYAYLTDEFLEIQSLKTGYKYKIWSLNFPCIPPQIMGRIKAEIEATKKAKVKKTDWDRLRGRNQYRQILLELTREEAHLLHDLSKAKA